MKKVLFLFSFLPLFILGQNNTDAELWTGISLKYEFDNSLKLGYETQLRLDRNMSTLSNYYNELQAEYEVFKNVDIGIGYRRANKNNTEFIAAENRIVFNLEHAIKAKKLGLRFKTRARYQTEFDRLTTINDQFYPNVNQSVRLKFNLQYENDAFKRFTPFVEYELFKPIFPSELFSFIEAYRIGGGIKIDLPKKHAFEVNYIYDYTLRNNFSRHIYVIQYSYEITDKLFRRKKK
jgi:hypothetical protein